MLSACETCAGLNRRQLGLMSFKKLFNVFYQGLVLSLFSEGKCHIVATKETHGIPETRCKEKVPSMNRPDSHQGFWKTAETSGTQGEGVISGHLSAI